MLLPTQSEIVDTHDEYQLKSENIQPIRQKTIHEIMTQSDIPFSDLSEDQQINSKYTLGTSIASISNDEISTEQLENELTDVHTKTRNIEEMIDRFFSNSSGKT